MLTVTHRKDFKYPMVIYNQDHHALEIGNRIYIYAIGLDEPNYPVPAISLSVHWPDTGYIGCVYIDDDSNPNDPNMVYMWDSWVETGRDW